jgi:hypothetical protein
MSQAARTAVVVGASRRLGRGIAKAADTLTRVWKGGSAL